MKLIKWILAFGFLGLFVPNYGQRYQIDLEKAFEKNSKSMYKDFLTEWRKESVPIRSKDSLSAIDKDIYEIYTDFYNPFNLSRIGYGERGEELYSRVKYVVVQNSIYAFTYKTDSIDFNSMFEKDTLIHSKDSIMNFRPNLFFQEARVLYLTPKYDTIINKFLGNEHYELGTGNIMNPAKEKGNSAKRLEFLNDKLLIIYGHWGGYWHIETHPYVFRIDFNKDRTIAKVHFRLVYQGGEANYYKENGIWKLKNSYMTWIE